jgi:hypothetical protein
MQMVRTVGSCWPVRQSGTTSGFERKPPQDVCEASAQSVTSSVGPAVHSHVILSTLPRSRFIRSEWHEIGLRSTSIGAPRRGVGRDRSRITSQKTIVIDGGQRAVDWSHP